MLLTIKPDLKARMVKRYTASRPEVHGDRWHGTCAAWADEARKNGMTVKVESVLAIGPKIPCGACNGVHVVLPVSWDPNA